MIKLLIGNYHGSVDSIKYGKIWREELKDNPDLFKTYIVSTHETRREALYKEYDLQVIFNVVKSNEFINMSLACKNGFVGMIVYGKDHPRYGKKHTKETLELMSLKQSGENNPMFDKKGELCPNFGLKRTEEQRKANGLLKLGTKLTLEHRQKISEGGKGRVFTNDTRNKIKDKNLGIMTAFNYIDLKIEMIPKDLYNEYKSTKYLMSRNNSI